MVGKLNYLVVTRLDIAYSVNIVNQFITSPTVDHWTALQQVLRYLKVAPERGVLYANHGHMKIKSFSKVN